MTAAHQPEVNGVGGGPLEIRIASDDELASEAPAKTRPRGPAEQMRVRAETYLPSL